MTRKTKVIMLSIFCLLLFFFSSLNLCTEPMSVTSIQIVTPNWKNMTNKDGTGLYFDILRKVFESEGIKVNYRIVPWKRAKNMIKNREADAMLVGYHAKFTEDLFPRYPIDLEPISILYKKGLVKDWKAQKSLEGKRVAWIRGYGFSFYLKAKIIKHEINNQSQGWKLIQSNRIDFFMHPLSELKNYIKSNQIDMTQFETHIVFEKNLYIRFANTEKSKKLIAIYDEKISELLKTGEVEKLFAKWQNYFNGLKPRDESKK